MEFNVSTFVLEVINFLVLIWILQRLFYKPLLAVIAKRKQFIDQSLADAKAIQETAAAERSLYENRLKLWEQEKQAALVTFQQQLDVERSKQLEALQAELEQEKQKAKITLSYQQQQLQQQTERQALQNATRFAGLLLQQAATPELETRLCELLLKEWASLPEACCGHFQALADKKNILIKVTSAFPLSAEMHRQLEQKLEALTLKPVKINYAEEPALMAGLRIDIGPWVLNANLQHELVGFAEIAHVTE
ncbi:MAG: F0F1 ATP synthase subunit delta [Methylococcales bacterium]|nr:F0F1 ATP synthase subunit delta [Methylococcales bacterium]